MPRKIAFAPQGKIIGSWCPAHPIKPKNHFPLECVRKSSFTTSFVKAVDIPSMTDLMHWKFGRLYHEEHGKFAQAKPTKLKLNFIKPDIYCRTKGHFSKYFDQKIRRK